MYNNLTGYCGPGSNLVSSPHQNTPLHLAAASGHGGAVELLLQAGTDVNVNKDDSEVSE